MRSITIALSDELAEVVAAKVVAGDDLTGSDVIRDGLMTLLDDGGALDDRMRDEVVAIYDRMKADPSRGIPIDDVLIRIQQRAPNRL